MFVASFEARCEAEARRVNHEYESQMNIAAHGRLHIARRELLHVLHEKPIFLVTIIQSDSLSQ
jgi:hypothetical protein